MRKRPPKNNAFWAKIIIIDFSSVGMTLPWRKWCQNTDKPFKRTDLTYAHERIDPGNWFQTAAKLFTRGSKTRTAPAARAWSGPYFDRGVVMYLT